MRRLLPLALLACGLKAAPVHAPPEAVADPVPAAGGVDSPALRELLAAHWDATMRRSPVWATMLGDHRFDDRLWDPSAKAREAARIDRSTWLRRAREIGAGELSGRDRTTLELFTFDLESAERAEPCRFWAWSVSPRGNVVADLVDLPRFHPVVSRADFDHLASRYRAIPAVVDGEIANLREGLSLGLVANEHSVALVIEQIDRLLAKPVGNWPLLAVEFSEPGWPDMEAAARRAELERIVEAEILPAFQRYRDLLADEVVPKARPDTSPGLASLPGGDVCYAAVVQEYTTLPKTPDELHATGLAELERVHAELRALGKKLWGIDDLALIIDKLRNDPELHFHSSEEVFAKAEEALRRAEAAIPRAFGRLPEAPCVVEAIPEFEAPYTTIAYYRPPNPDGSQPGTYFVNTYAPETRPIAEAEVLAFHESIPGHHLQIAIAQELPDLPLFRKHMGFTAFVEGWGLYSERVAADLGLYSGDLDRMGALSFESWRAARLVVDTGLHAEGWSRVEAERFMLENTPLAENNVVNEVDRYVTTPGQALAYKTGQLEILALRAQAEAALGDRFDVRAFHDTVLGGGAVTLPVLRRQVEAWIASRR